ncbi:MAG TPA: PH domain-containing protein [Longimicrobiales bacterium]
MFERVRGLLLRALRVPAEPTPPHGARDARVFRASERYYRYKLLRWALSQAATLFGLVAGILTLRAVPGLPDFLLALETVAVVSFLLQLPFTYAALRLDFELRWYIVTDRSLRIREGLATIREQTMTFANIQNIEVRQGPLQRLLGIADVEVRSAGGGAKASGESMRDTHVGLFRGVDNAHAIRAAVLDRIRRYRDAGLGDPDDLVAGAHTPLAAQMEATPAAASATGPSLLAAARELAAEARALREALARAGG